MLLPATRLYKSKSHISEFIKAKSKVVAKIGLLDKKNDKRLSIKYLLKVLDHKSECSMKFKDSLKKLKFNFRTHPVFSFAFIIATVFVVLSFALCFTRMSFVKQCENGDIAACNRACAIKGRTACANLAFYYQQGIHVRKNEQKALYYYQKSCSQKLSYACRQAEQIEKQFNYKILNNQ